MPPAAGRKRFALPWLGSTAPSALKTPAPQRPTAAEPTTTMAEKEMDADTFAGTITSATTAAIGDGAGAGTTASRCVFGEVGWKRPPARKGERRGEGGTAVVDDFALL